MGCVAAAAHEAALELTAPAKKKILVFTSKGGGAHMAAANALEAYLNGNYLVRRAFFFEEVLGPLDPFVTMSFGRLSGEGLYNLCLRRGWHGLATFFCDKFGAPKMINLAAEIERLALPFVRAEKPDLIVSLIPLVDAILLRVAETLDIPFLIVPVDLDTSNYINGLQGGYFGGFRYTLPFGDREIWEKMSPARIPRAQVKVIGFPVRPDFHESKDVRRLKLELDLPETKPIVMLLMGAVGSTTILAYLRSLAEIRIPVHLLVCVGRNQKLESQVEALPFPRKVTRTIVGHTDRISDLMAVSDLVITKPGPASISEAIYMNRPMLLDGTSRVLRWEELNLQFVRKHGFGDVVRAHRDVAGQVEKYLRDRAHYRRAVRSLEWFPKANFGQSFRALLADLAP
jgi:UDP-N-acetylglucosamine:LPS N-acetylglucosamine transferase